MPEDKPLPKPKMFPPDMLNGTHGNARIEASVEMYADAIRSNSSNLLPYIDQAIKLCTEVLSERLKPVKTLKNGKTVELQTKEITRDICQIVKSLGFIRALYSIEKKSKDGPTSTLTYEDFIKREMGEGDG